MMEKIIARIEDESLMEGDDQILQNALRAGVIQHFEIVYELCWKYIQRWIRENRTPEDADNPRTRKELFRMAARYRLIEDPLPWFAYGDARNLTSHTYKEEKAQEVYDAARAMVEDARYLIERLRKTND